LAIILALARAFDVVRLVSGMPSDSSDERRDILGKRVARRNLYYSAYSIPMGRNLAQAILAVTTFAVATASLLPSPIVQDDVQYNFDTHIKPNIKVPVALGVMSQCPDALICESIFDQVLHKVANKMDLTLRYIA
jgi:hypothetical protein